MHPPFRLFHWEKSCYRQTDGSQLPMSNMLSGGLPGPHNPTYVNCSETNPSWENKRSSWKGRSQIREMQPRHQPQAFASGCKVAAERSRSLNAPLGNLLPTKAEANPACVHLPARQRTEAASSRWCSWEGGRKRRGRRHEAKAEQSTSASASTSLAAEQTETNNALEAPVQLRTSFICMLSGAELIRGISGDLN